MKFKTKFFSALLLSAAIIFSTAATAAEVREAHNQPEQAQAVYTAAATDEADDESLLPDDTVSPYQELTPQQQAEFSRVMTQKISDMMQNSMTPEEFAKINGLPFHEAETKKQTGDAEAFLNSPVTQQMMTDSLGLMKMPQQLGVDARTKRQAEQYNRAVQQQLDRIMVR